MSKEESEASICVRLGVVVCEGERRREKKVRGRCAFVYGCANVCECVYVCARVCSCLSAFAQRRADMTGLSVVSPE